MKHFNHGKKFSNMKLFSCFHAKRIVVLIIMIEQQQGGAIHNKCNNNGPPAKDGLFYKQDL